MDRAHDILECTDAATSAMIEVLLQQTENAEQAAMSVAALTAFVCDLFQLQLPKVIQLIQVLHERGRSVTLN